LGEIENSPVFLRLTQLPVNLILFINPSLDDSWSLLHHIAQIEPIAQIDQIDQIAQIDTLSAAKSVLRSTHSTMFQGLGLRRINLLFGLTTENGF